MAEKLDLDFFENVIAYHLLTDELYLASVCEDLSPTYFKDKNVQTIVSVITEFYKTRNTVPNTSEIKSYLTTAELKKAFVSLVQSFNNLDKNFNKDELYANTESFLKQKAVYHTMMEVVDKCTSGEVDTPEILSKFEKACGITLSADLGLEFFSEIDRHIDDLTTEEKHIPSGWEWLDRKLGGGFLETGRSLYLFAGQTNVGKSIFLGNIATNVAEQGKTVVLISLEMSELMYAKRISSKVTGINIGDLQTSSELVKTRVEDFTKRKKPKLIIKEFPPNAVTANQISAYLKKLINKGIKPDMVVLDYINLLNSPIGNNSYERVKHTSEQVRALSYTFKCPFVTATQINRSGINEQNPGVENISESIGLAATADCIMSIWQEEGDVDLGVIRLGMMKNRYGQNFGSCAMAIDYSTLNLTQTQMINNTEEMDGVDRTLTTLEDL